eukprot:scaffold3339_cov174-Amphora_coffeaeformis.AAC.5
MEGTQVKLTNCAPSTHLYILRAMMEQAREILLSRNEYNQLKDLDLGSSHSWRWQILLLGSNRDTVSIYFYVWSGRYMANTDMFSHPRSSRYVILKTIKDLANDVISSSWLAQGGNALSHEDIDDSLAFSFWCQSKGCRIFVTFSQLCSE